MPANHGSSSILLKLGLVVVAVAVAGAAVFYQLRETAVVATVTRGLAVDTVSGSVVVYAERGLRTLTSEAEGKVAWCEALETGRHFKQGDLLLQLDTTELDRQIAQSNLDYETAQKRIEIVFAGKPAWKAARQKLDEAILRQRAGTGSAEEVARLQDELDAVARSINPRRIAAVEALENATRLHDRGELADFQWKAAKDSLDNIDTELRLADFDAANARRAHELAMKNALAQLEKMKVIAPTDGVVDSTTMWKGALIGRGTVVTTFFSDARVVVAKIGEEDFNKIKVGQQAYVRLVIYTGQPPFDAKISKILPTAEPETQRYTAFLDVEVETAKLVPNSNGQVNITVGEHPDVPLIPRRAVFDRDKVWVVKDGRMSLRSIKLGFVSDSKVEVTEGLTPGEQVVVEDVRTFRPGQFVRTELPKP